jgi:RNA polymerase sigma-70 factor (ECF subfamily)
MDALQVVESVARDSYGRLVAYLSARSRDVAGAEDALSEALQAALATWPRDGVPDKPEAWLLATARRRLIDEARHLEVRIKAEPFLQLLAEQGGNVSEGIFPDERLKLLFVCAHPAIDAAARTPLMLQTVLGLDAARIASAFLVAPAAMSQRLVRAKAKIRAAGIAFEVPEESELAARLDSVLEAIYAAYGTGWEDASGTDAQRKGLADEALWLARVVVQLLPRAAEARGLLALMLHCEARRTARRSMTGDYVPLTEQDTRLWSRPLMDEAEMQLSVAASLKAPGHFQLEAAIQSVHAQRRAAGPTEWDAIVQFYDELVRLAPTLGARISRAAAIAELHGPAAGLAALDEVPSGTVTAYQPYWAVRAHLLAGLNQADAAHQAYTRAIGLSEDEAVRRFLMRRKKALA